MQHMKVILKTTAVRLSLLFLVLFVVSATVLVFYVSSISDTLLRKQTELAISRELRGVNNAYRNGNFNNVMRYIERRSRQPGSNLFIIASPSGEIFAGNVAEIAPGIFDKEGRVGRIFKYKRFGDFNNEYKALAHVIRLSNGFKLLIGRDLGEPGRFSDLIRRALVTALTIMGVGALAIWFFVGRSALKRIDHMSMASKKIMAGDLAQRLPVTGSGDEFDRLSISLNTMLSRIERLNEGLRQVSDNIAHDLKTPLTRLRNRAESTLSSPSTSEDYRKALEDMILQSDQLIGIFSALLMISRVESGSAAAQLTNINLSAITLDAFELYEPVVEEVNIKLVSEIEQGIEINGSRELIGQALSNLIDNAIKYASGTDCDHEEASIRIKLKKSDKDIHLIVADNGSGVSDDEYGEIVKRFVRLDKSRNKPGTGLGLALVDAVMRTHGGQLKLHPTNPERETFKGLTATLIFPMSL